MARDDAYLKAERKIEEARRTQKRDLYLGHMTLTELPESLGQLTELRYLDISQNRLTELPEWLGRLTQLQSLDAAGNQLTELPEWLGHLMQLKSLEVSNNRLTRLPDTLGRLSRLEHLLLSMNHLDELPDSFSGFTRLELLSISENRFSRFPAVICQLERLVSFSATRNQIPSIPEEIRNLTLLESLLLGGEEFFRAHLGFYSSYVSRSRRPSNHQWPGNLLQTLPIGISRLTKLKELELSGNPLNPELAAAYREGVEAVKRYLRAQAGERVTLNEAKLIVVGEGEVGKSCLLGALRGDPWVENRDTTHGIEIKPVKVTDPASGTEMTLNGWDFGGQRVYRPTHQLFFSAPAVYLVVWKPREGPQQGFVKDWIKLVKHREPEAKILVVATHGGPGARQPDIDRQEIWDLFGKEMVIDFFHVDSRPDKSGNCDGVEALKRKIAEVAASLPEMGREVPKSWQQARQALKRVKAAHITTSRALGICAKEKMSKEDAKLFLTIEHRLGHLIHYGNDEVLHDIVVLKPDWLATAISFVLDDKITREAHGLVNATRFDELWNDPHRAQAFRYPAKLHAVFVRLMERYDLCYRVASLGESAGDGAYLIAQLVPDVKPGQILGWAAKTPAGEEEQVQICRIVESQGGQSANAEGLFFQLIVRLHKFSLGRVDYQESSHWQRGLVLDDDYNGRALLEHVGNDVKITVRAAYPEAFLSVLTSEVKWLVESFWKGMRCEVVVPCVAPCGKKLPGTGVFEVQKLIAFKKQGVTKFPCFVSGCNQLQDIDCLLRNASAARAAVALELQSGYQGFREELGRARDLLVEQHGETMRQFHGLNVVTLRIMSKVDDGFASLMTAFTDEAKDGPRLFTMAPVAPGFFDKPNWLSQKFRVTLWCEHSRLPVWALSDRSRTSLDDQEGVYDFDVPREWFVKAAPFLKLLGTTLSLALPVASAATKVLLDERTFKEIDRQLELGNKSVESLVKAGEKIGEWLLEEEGEAMVHGGGEGGGVIRAEGGTLRQLQAWLKERDPGFGGLQRVQNKRHEFLWVHPQFAGEY
ncbi:MAG TPA: COR domain-containing protein [Chthoniobacter sp.]|jgi:hypothetical protein